MPFNETPGYLPHPDTWRGVCAFCGAAQRTLEGGVPEKVWDTGLKIDDGDGIYGGVFICESCVRDLANQSGMVGASQATELQAEANDLRAERDALDADVKELTALVDSLRTFNDRNPQDGTVVTQPPTAASPANAVGEAPAPGEHLPSDSTGQPIPTPPAVETPGIPSTPAAEPQPVDADGNPIPAPAETPPQGIDPQAAEADAAPTIPAENEPTTATVADDNLPSADNAPEAAPPA